MVDGGSRTGFLSQIEVTHPILTIADAKDPVHIQWCVDQLSAGMRLDELRRHLGLGPSHVDKRWREIKRHIFAQLPENEDESLKAAYDLSVEGEVRITERIEAIEVELEQLGFDEDDIKVRHHYHKMLLEAESMLQELSNNKHKQYMDLKKAKATKHGVLNGVTIIMNTNTPRPTKKERQVQEQIMSITADATESIDE